MLWQGVAGQCTDADGRKKKSSHPRRWSARSRKTLKSLVLVFICAVCYFAILMVDRAWKRGSPF
jgi:hypothetical protein